ncbi:MAG: hypothetical protein PHH00_00030 [Candidatus Nanoarchaeia archaeon]|nr:hypothetical protein [Candidatus Nanoarchaeia archaeon]
MNKSILNEIKKKREFSELPDIDIELAYNHFEKRQASDEEKIKLTRELLRKIFSAFVSKKLLSLKNKDEEWILRKHASTRERLPYYTELYRKIFSGYKKASIIDLGAGINGFSYGFFKKSGINADYTAIESVGQLADLMNFYFKKEKLNGTAIHLSLFEKEKVLDIISHEKSPRIVLLFKIIDALESLKRDYSKELILDVGKIAERLVLSFPTKSLGSREKFHARRNWIVDFLGNNFKILDDFEINGERYIVFEKR